MAILAVASLTRPASADPLPYVSFTTTSYIVNEGGGGVTLTLTLSAPASYPVQVQFTTADGSATSGGGSPNYVSASGTATFAPGQTTTALPPITILADGVYSGDKTFAVTLSNPYGAALAGSPQATVTIHNTDPMPTVQLDQSSYRVNADSGQASVDVILTGASAFPVTVGYVSFDGTATATGPTPDYVAVPANSTMTFAPGQTRKAFAVAILASGNNPDKAFGVAIQSPSGATLGDPAMATVTISSTSSSINVVASADDFLPSVTFVGEQATAALTASADTSLAEFYPDLVGPSWMRPSGGSPPGSWQIDVAYHPTDPTATQTASPSSYACVVEQPGMPATPDAVLRFTPYVAGYWRATARPYVSYKSGAVVFANEGVARLALLQVGAARVAAGKFDAPTVETGPSNDFKWLGAPWKEQIGDVENLKGWWTRYKAPLAGDVVRWECQYAGGGNVLPFGTKAGTQDAKEAKAGTYSVWYVRMDDGGKEKKSASKSVTVCDVASPDGAGGFELTAPGSYVKQKLNPASPFGYISPGIAIQMTGRVDLVTDSPLPKSHRWGFVQGVSATHEAKQQPSVIYWDPRIPKRAGEKKGAVYTTAEYATLLSPMPKMGTYICDGVGNQLYGRLDESGFPFSVAPTPRFKIDTPGWDDNSFDRKYPGGGAPTPGDPYFRVYWGSLVRKKHDFKYKVWLVVFNTTTEQYAALRQIDWELHIDTEQVDKDWKAEIKGEKKGAACEQPPDKARTVVADGTTNYKKPVNSKTTVVIENK